MALPFPLPTELTIYGVAALREAALDASAREAEPVLRVDGAAVAEVDAMGVQLLVAWQHSLAAQGRTLQLERASDGLRRALALTGLSDWLPAEAQS